MMGGGKGGAKTVTAAFQRKKKSVKTGISLGSNNKKLQNLEGAAFTVKSEFTAS